MAYEKCCELTLQKRKNNIKMLNIRNGPKNNKFGLNFFSFFSSKCYPQRTEILTDN